MYRLAALAALIVAIGCGAPVPTAVPSPEPTTNPRPTLSSAVQQELKGWQVTCTEVEFADCHGVAALFVNNLAWSTSSIHEASGGLVTVTTRPECPDVQDYIDPSFCWQASATADTQLVCMVIGRQLPIVPEDARRFGFGQVGGDDYSGRITVPGAPTMAPCI
jgi:hypothetical protein